MMELAVIIPYLEPLQICAAVVFIPLVCWYFAHGLSLLGLWCAVFSGYFMQIGLFILLDDVGLPSNLLILIASVAAYFWIATTLVLLPGMAQKPPSRVKSPARAKSLPPSGLEP
jgi:hypothetical protein